MSIRGQTLDMVAWWGAVDHQGEGDEQGAAAVVHPAGRVQVRFHHRAG